MLSPGRRSGADRRIRARGGPPRAFQGPTCAVPVGGAAPTDASVRALSHPDAYPISFVTLRRLRTATPIVAAFLKYLTGPRATESSRQRGILLCKEAWPGPPGP